MSLKENLLGYIFAWDELDEEIVEMCNGNNSEADGEIFGENVAEDCERT